ncbi:MAG: response regulator transcription factor [Halarcobacter sp.]
MKILVLEDNTRLSKLIKESLEEKNYKVDLFEDGKEAVKKIYDGYDCFVLDINVPGIDGLTILSEIKNIEKKIPCIIISANVDLETLKDAYGKGCNEYLKKPFYIYELELKIEKLCKKDRDLILLKDDTSYSLEKEKLFKGEEEIKLSKKEILLLNLFSKNLEKIVTFEHIEQYVWEGDLTTTENIRALIKRIRRKLPKDTIVSQGGMGYKLVLRDK